MNRSVDPQSPATCAPSGSATPAEQVAADLQRLMTHEIPSARDIRLQSLVRAAGGLSRENWSLDAAWTDAAGAHKHPLMLMRDASGTLLNTERGREYAVLKALEGTDVPAPRVYWMDPQGQFLGAPSVVMERVSGSCDYMVLNGSRPLDERLALARGFIELMAAIHRVDWRARGLERSLGLPQHSPARTELAHWQAEYQRVRLEPHPELDLILSWLQQEAPITETIALVHGDFKPGNALIEGQRISAKLDWETAHLGDPLEDLGWVTNPVRKREHQIPGHWERRQIVDAYQALTGRTVSQSDLSWWNVLACWKLAVIQLTAVHEFVAGRYNRVFQTPSWLYRPMFQMMEAA
jgi:aminoglycoside phosphotransferase (APT) family kinase protein